MVGLIPLLPSAEVPAWSVDRGARLGKRFASFLEAHAGHRRRGLREGGFVTGDPGRETFMVSVVPPARLSKLLARDAVARTPSCRRHGLRALSKRHATEPFKLELGGLTARGRLRARRIDVGPVRRQLELARTGLVPAQLPDHRVAPELGYLAR